MKPIFLNLHDEHFSIHFSTGKKDEMVEKIGETFQSNHWVVVTNKTLGKIYSNSLQKQLRSLGKISWIEIPDGERFKTLRTVEKIYQRFIELKVDRKTPILAFGGGVVGDITGFAAATFLRGVPLIQIPTTLLAQVDSSVGGKTGVDLKSGKNLVGAFYQPHLVWIDPLFLKTLPPRQILCGTAEVIKYGAIQSLSLFSKLEKEMGNFLKLQENLTQEIVRECVSIKAKIVQEDEKETKGLRALLNFGHTLGHAIETLSGYAKFTHGEAISIGMEFAGFLSNRLSGLNDPSKERLKNLLQKAGLPVQLPRFSPAEYLEVMSRDKKMVSGQIQYVLLESLGKALLRKLELKEIGKLLREF